MRQWNHDNLAVKNRKGNPEVCGAKTRSGNPCKGIAMANGRCRKHGGVCSKTHAGNQHAVKHGVHATVLPEEIEAVLNEDPSLIARIAVAVGRVRILRAHEANKDELVAKLLPGVIKGAATIAALERADGGGGADEDNQAARIERRKKLEDVLKSVKPAGPAGSSAVDSVQSATGSGSDLDR